MPDDSGWQDIAYIRERLAKLEEALSSSVKTAEKTEMHLRALSDISHRLERIEMRTESNTTLFERLDDEVSKVKDDYRRMETNVSDNASLMKDLKNYFSSRVWIATTLLLIGIGLIDYAFRALL